MIALALKYIAVALLLAYMNHVFSKKKAVCIDVKRHIIEKRLHAYAKLHKTMLSDTSLIAPPAYQEQSYWSLMSGMPFSIGDQKMEYASHFSSYDALCAYVCKLRQDGGAGHSFLPDDIVKSISLVIEWYDLVLELVTAFKLAEENECGGEARHTDMLCHAFGIALQNDITIIHSHLSRMLADRLQQPSLLNLFKVSVVDKWRMRHFEQRFDKLQLFAFSQYLSLVMVLVHVSDKYSRKQFDELPAGERSRIVSSFNKSLVKFLSHD